jgi:hypothetical protein
MSGIHGIGVGEHNAPFARPHVLMSTDLQSNDPALHKDVSLDDFEVCGHAGLNPRLFELTVNAKLTTRSYGGQLDGD